ncbi:Uncharacterised protein [uncultured archaeon]|nr:Uncharacterised protein [uncultured archaeon]
MNDAFLICTVREADDNDRKFINDYLVKLRSQGKTVYYPAEDTEQVDSSGGYQICSDNCWGIMDSKEVHVYWTDKSQGTKFDLGMAFIQHKMIGKKIRLANRSQVEKMVEEQKSKNIGKSFEMVLLKLDDLANQ